MLLVWICSKRVTFKWSTVPQNVWWLIIMFPLKNCSRPAYIASLPLLDKPTTKSLSMEIFDLPIMIWNPCCCAITDLVVLILAPRPRLGQRHPAIQFPNLVPVLRIPVGTFEPGKNGLPKLPAPWTPLDPMFFLFFTVVHPSLLRTS